jgi:hypothetical protein
VARQVDSKQIEPGVRDPMTNWAAVQAARKRPMSERLELALSWNSVAAELRAGMVSLKESNAPERP